MVSIDEPAENGLRRRPHSRSFTRGDSRVRSGDSHTQASGIVTPGSAFQALPTQLVEYKSFLAPAVKVSFYLQLDTDRDLHYSFFEF